MLRLSLAVKIVMANIKGHKVVQCANPPAIP
jgi:hypothetical protein